MQSSWVNKSSSIKRIQQLSVYRDLVVSLAKRDIKARYRRTFLGPLWTVIPAILTMAIFTFLNGVINIDSQDVPYVVFAFSTIVPWTYFQRALNMIPRSVLSNSGLLKKLAIPRTIFPLVALVMALFDFAMSAIVLLIILLLYQVPITIAWLWLPLLLFLLSALAWVVGLAITAISVYRRDILQGMTYILQLWFYITPVVYSLDSISPELQLIYGLNPAVGIIDGFRQVLVFGESPDVTLLFLGTLVTILIGLIGYPLFREMSKYFVDVL